MKSMSGLSCQEIRIRSQRLACDAVSICVKVVRVPASAVLKEVLSFPPRSEVATLAIRFIGVRPENFARDAITIPVKIVWVPAPLRS